MAGGPAGPHQVGGHHRLAVSGRQRVDRAPGERRQQQERQHAAPAGGVGEHAGEAVARAVGGGAGFRVATGRCGHRSVAGPHLERCAALVQRTGEGVLRVPTQPAGGIGLRDARAHRRARARPHHDRLPAHPVGERAVVDGDVSGRDRRSDQVELHPRER